MAQHTLHGLQPPETNDLFNEKGYRVLSEIAEQATKRAEVSRLRELHTLKGHVESVVKLKGLDIDNMHQHYTLWFGVEESERSIEHNKEWSGVVVPLLSSCTLPSFFIGNKAAPEIDHSVVAFGWRRRLHDRNKADSPKPCFRSIQLEMELVL